MFFYDTCSLLKELDKVFLTNFAISNISLMELENIKTSATKDEETKYRARKILHLLEKYEDKFTLVIFKDGQMIYDFSNAYNSISRAHTMYDEELNQIVTIIILE